MSLNVHPRQIEFLFLSGKTSDHNSSVLPLHQRPACHQDHYRENPKAKYLNPAKRKAMAVKNEKRFLKQKRNALKNPGYSRHPVKTQASFKRLLKAV